MVKQIIKWLLALLKIELMPKQGDKGQEVKLIQEVLGLKIDGDFGPLTKKAVVEYQEKNNYKPSRSLNHSANTLHSDLSRSVQLIKKLMKVKNDK